MPREQVVENQRLRLLGAATEVVAERGVAETTTARIVRQAGVSSSTFYTHFANADDCLAASYGFVRDSFVDVVRDGCGEGADPLHGAIERSFDFLAQDPGMAGLLGREVAAAIPAVATLRQELVEDLAALLRRSQAASPGRRGGGDGLEPLLVAGCFAFVLAERSEPGRDGSTNVGRDLIEILRTVIP
jgi:AcrR family transcriptional regulator